MYDEEIAKIRAIDDPLKRMQVANDRQDDHRRAMSALSALRREAYDEAKGNGLKPAEIARALGISTARVSQIGKGGTPERALLAPDAGALTLVLTQKAENEHDRPALMLSTHAAARKLEKLADGYDIGTSEDFVPLSGRIDLSRNNLVVLAGPRISPAIETAISVDPVIKWSAESGQWALTDTATDTTYSSDFDERRRKTGTCYAHVGRLRRPDGKGTFLYIGGVHAPGTAGAVDLVTSDIIKLWGQVQRKSWSAIVATTVHDDGTATSELATPIYTHK